MSPQAPRTRRSLRSTVAVHALALVALLALAGPALAAGTTPTAGSSTADPSPTTTGPAPTSTSAAATVTPAAVSEAPAVVKKPVVKKPVVKKPVVKVTRPHPHKIFRAPRPHPHKIFKAPRPHPHQAPRITHVVIGTAPAVAGFPVTLSGNTQLTDSTGKVHWDTPETSQSLSSRVSFNEVILPIGGRSVKATPTRMYRFTSGAQIALDLSYLVDFRFTSPNWLNGGPVINALTVRSMTGEVAELPAEGSSWLSAARALPKRGGLEVKNIAWSVQRVTYGGSNVVNESQQRFSPAALSTVVVKLLFYSVNLHVRDVLFGSSRPGTITLVFPNGKPQQFPVDRKGWLHLQTVPRGNYVLTAHGPGPDMPVPVSISRNQTIDVNFYSWLDIATVLGVIVLLATLLALVGWLRRRRARNRSTDAELPAQDEPTQDELPAAEEAPNVVVPPDSEDGDAAPVPLPREPAPAELVDVSDSRL